MERRFTTQRSAKISVEARAAKQPRIIGYASVFYDGSPETEYQLWSDAVERIMPGAFDAAIKSEQDVRGLFNHDPNLLLGRTAAGTLALDTDATGLRYVIEPGETSVARDVVEHVRRGDLTGSSFAFRVVDERWRVEQVNGRDLEIREILGVDLYDVGPVTFPAYEASTTGLRSDGAVGEARASRDAWRAEAARQARRARAEAVAEETRKRMA